ncbi:ABC transporter ATP-binding protein [Actinophytocola sp.]|uniref:ABC transporter ATP-binding protein n=1 Tax=Actinophytocola sp. TaxID=1872138 RepID=UPI0038999A4B
MRRPPWADKPWPSLVVLRMLPTAGRGLTWTLAVITLVAGLAPTLAIVASGWMVRYITLAGSEGLGTPDGHRAVAALVVLAALFVLSQAAARVSTALATALGSRVDARLQRRAIRAVNGPAGVEHLDDPEVRNLLSRITGIGSGGYTPGGAVSGLVTNAVQLVQSVTALVVLCLYHWWLALPVFLAGLWWSREGRRDYLSQTRALTQQTTLLRRSVYLRDLVLKPAAAKEIRLFGLTGWLTDRYRTDWDDAMAVVWRRRGQHSVPVFTALLVLTAANFLVLALLGADAVHHVVGLSAAVVFLRSVIVIGQVSARGQQDMQIAYGLSALPAVTAVERAAAHAVERPGAAPPADRAGVRIDLENVSFHYPGSTTPVLDGLDLVIPASRSLAVVGANGAGKTTLIKLLCRFYDPDAGTILADGKDLRDLAARDWQRRVAAVFQDFQRFELTARENIGFGALPLLGDTATMRRTAARAGILDRIEALPGGWDTPLARHLDGGTDLSGGEWQRIALARALLAVEAGARLLVLDEPTASLDVRAESAFYERFLELTHGITTIVISHRFATVRRADLICVLQGGAVAELGPHDELMAAGGEYARMYTAQSARYDEEERSAPTEEAP